VPTILLNICLSIDLVLVVRNPFSSHEKRTSWYVVLSVFCGVLTAILKVISSRKQAFRDGLAFLEIFEFGTLIILAVVSILIAGYRLLQPGVKREIRSLIIKRHILYICVFLVCNMYVVLLVSHLTRNQHHPETTTEFVFYGFFQLLYFS